MKPNEILGRVTLIETPAGLTKAVVTTAVSSAEVYTHGAHITAFQKNGEPPLLFTSAESLFAPGKAIRGGVPICFPWFGNREGDVAHGFARTTAWQLVKTAAVSDGTIILLFALPALPARPDWKNLRTEFIVTVADKLTMELTVTNDSCDGPIMIENCLHTYFTVGDIGQVSLTGLKGHTYIDKVDNFTRKQETGDALRISSEVDRVFPNATGPVEIHDASLRRKILVEKSGSASCVVWNPWIAKAKAMADFGDEEYHRMVCVEAGNVGENKITLAPGQSKSLKVTLGSQPL